MMENQKIKTIFIGTPDFSVPSLQALIDAPEFELVGVISQPDRKVGRKQILTPTPIKVLAEKNNIPVWQPASLKSFEFPIKNLDLIVVIAYAQIIPQNILDFPKYDCINVHGSLLPRYRGAACVQAPILNGDQESGITIMKMDKGLDTGPIIKQFSLKLSNTETTGQLFEKLSLLSKHELIPTLLNYIIGKLTPLAQDEANASYSRTLKKDDGHLNWHWPAEKNERFVRAMQPWPGAFSFLEDGKKLVVLETDQNFVAIKKAKAGTILDMNKQLVIMTQDKGITIRKIQIEGKKPVSGEEFLKGYSKYINTKLT